MMLPAESPHNHWTEEKHVLLFSPCILTFWLDALGGMGTVTLFLIIIIIILIVLLEHDTPVILILGSMPFTNNVIHIQ